MKFRRDTATAPPPKQKTDAEDWEQWRGFIGSKRVCPECGLVIGDPDIHAAWHQGPASKSNQVG